jgi:hypothetical protein
MSGLAHQRCFNHASREAVARCPECRRNFCRECIAEHDDRILCAACLKKQAAGPAEARRRFAGLARACQCLMGILTLWFFFHLVGESLLAMPASFHEGTFWTAGWLDTP